MSIPNDRIFIDSLSLKCSCGLDAFGLVELQSVLLSVSLETETAIGAEGNEVNLDYRRIGQQLEDLETIAHDSVVHLVNRATELMLRTAGLVKVSVTADIEKGLLAAKNVRWRKIMGTGKSMREDWECCVQGLQASLVFLAEGDIHERVHEHTVILDLWWHGLHGDATSLHTFPIKNLVDSILNVRSHSS
jgi:tetrahydromethanopterin S-methyltransferase subunit B